MARAQRSNAQQKAASTGKGVAPNARSGKVASPTALGSGKVLKRATGSKLGRPERVGTLTTKSQRGLALSQSADTSGKASRAIRTGPASGGSGGGQISRRAEAIRKVDAAFASGSVDVLVIPIDDAGSLTSQNVADILNVSRPYVVKLAKQGELPHQMVGTHHRFRSQDVEAYNARMRAERRSALAAMSAETEYRDEDF